MKKIFSVRNFLLGCLLIIAQPGCDQPSRVEITTNTEEGIRLGSLVEAGIDSSKLDSMTVAIVRKEYPNIHSVLIVKDKKLVFEKYWPGNDELLGKSLGIIDHHRDTLHDIRSITKSVVSACIGIAIAQQKIKDVDQSIWDYFPEYLELKRGDKAHLTIRHLLTMSSGLEWNENIPYTDPANSELQMDDSPDPVQFVLSRNLVQPPGKGWNYNGGTTQLLAAIIKKASGQEVDEYATDNLFEPLGIRHFFWIKFPDSGKTKNVPLAAAGLRMRSRDLVKFGLLYMNQGMWNGKRILEESWVNDSHKSHIGRENPSYQTGGYGYQFWTGKDTVGNKVIDLAVAVGNGDQRIFFDHVNDLMVVTTAGNYNQWTIKNNAGALLKNFIYPALQNLR